MNARTSTRLQLSAHRFRKHRREQLLLGISDGDAGSVRVQQIWLAAGALVAALILAANAVFGLVRAPQLPGDAVLLLGRESGTLYARIDDILHPVLNLSSARLAIGSPQVPRMVADDALPAGPRGALLGIPGAPGLIGAPLTGDDAAWTVCDGPETTVIAEPRNSTSTAPKGQVLVPGSSGVDYLLYDGIRAAVDRFDPVIARALRIDGLTPRPVSDALIATIPESAPIIAPAIPDAGAPGPEALAGRAIGDVVQVSRAGGTDLFVVLAGGVQRLGAVAADIIRSVTGQPGDIPVLAPSLIQQVPEVGPLKVDSYPQRVGIYEQDASYLCASWAQGHVELRATDRLPLPADTAAVTLTQADGAGPHVDAVAIPTGRSAYVRPDAGVPEPGTVISGTGVRFRIADDEAVRALGLPADAQPAPWSLIEHLPAGPELSRAAASLTRDVLGAGTA